MVNNYIHSFLLIWFLEYVIVYYKICEWLNLIGMMIQWINLLFLIILTYGTSTSLSYNVWS